MSVETQTDDVQISEVSNKAKKSNKKNVITSTHKQLEAKQQTANPKQTTKDDDLFMLDRFPSFICPEPRTIDVDVDTPVYEPSLEWIEAPGPKKPRQRKPNKTVPQHPQGRLPSTKTDASTDDSSPSPSSPTDDELNKRSLIVYGLTECNSPGGIVRLEADMEIVQSIVNHLFNETDKVSIFRLCRM